MALHQTYIICTGSIQVRHSAKLTVAHSDIGIDTPLEESIPALDEIRRAGKTKYIGLSECSASTLRKANSIATIDAVQAEYSAFETMHESTGLIDTARELGIAFVSYGPLGHGWLTDDFDYKSPDDFAPDDFRRTCM